MAHRTITDSRRAVRLSVNGEIRGRLVATEHELILRDVGAGGFLAETTIAIEVDSVHHVRLITPAGTSYVLAARCAHCRRRGVVAGVERFVVGFAFKTPNTAIDHMLDQLMGTVSFD